MIWMVIAFAWLALGTWVFNELHGGFSPVELQGVKEAVFVVLFWPLIVLIALYYWIRWAWKGRS